MRAKSVVGGLVASVVLVGGLVALLLRAPGAEEPSFQPTVTPRAEATANPEPPPFAGTRAASADAGVQAQPPQAHVEPEPSPAEAHADPSSAPLDCDHPFVPSAPGQWRRYSWRQSTEEEAAELRVEALSARDVERGEREITWRVEITASDDAALAREAMTTRCVPGQAAEEPWFGILERSLGLRMMGEPRWRWPAQLRAGARFEGVATFDTRGADMRAPEGVDGPIPLRVTRRHVVGEREPVEVPAGRWRAWRVDYEEEHAFGERGERGTGTAWIAPSVGMIRSTAENSRGVRQTIELIALGP